MPMIEFKIELKVDTDAGSDKEKVLIKAVREAARTLYTTASLISDKRKPQIAVTAGNFYANPEDIGIFDEGPKVTLAERNEEAQKILDEDGDDPELASI